MDNEVNDEVKISEKIAKEQIAGFKKFYRFKMKHIQEALKGVIETSFDRLEDAIMDGLLEIKVERNDIKITQTLEKSGGDSGLSKLTYKQLNGKAKIKTKNKEEYEKIYALMGFLSGEGEDIVSSLGPGDLTIMESLGVIFLQS